MLIARNSYRIDLLKDGTSRLEIIANSSLHYVNMLSNSRLIRIDERDRVFLTDRGKIASKFGLKKYLELEKLEEKALDYDREKTKIHSIIIILSLFFSILLIGLLNIYFFTIL